MIAVEVGKHRLVHARHKLVDFAAGYPADLVQFRFVANEDGSRVGVPGRPRSEVDHLPAGLRVDSPAQDPSGDYFQAGFFLGFSHGCVCCALARLELAGREGPERFLVGPADGEDSFGCGHDDSDDGRARGLTSLGCPGGVANDVRGPGLRQAEPLAELSKRQVLLVADRDRCARSFPPKGVPA